MKNQPPHINQIKPHCLYSASNLQISKIYRPTAFDKTLISSWKLAENENAFNYKINDCNLISKNVKVGRCNFMITLNEKRFSNRRKPQEMTTLDQPFNDQLFNFTKVKSNEILMTFGLRKEDQEYNHPKNENVIIINNSPFQEGHSLLVPELQSCFNQVMRKRPLRTALDTILISGEKNFVVAFNSLLACASVNHLHLHLWNTSCPLVSSVLNLHILISLENGRRVHFMPNHPVSNFVVQFGDQNTIDADFETLWIIVRNLQTLAIPHSICFVRACDQSIRAVVWPRCVETDSGLKLTANKIDNIINVAAAEMAGQIFTGDPDIFHNYVNEEVLEKSFSRVRVSVDQWNETVLSLTEALSN